MPDCNTIIIGDLVYFQNERQAMNDFLRNSKGYLFKEIENIVANLNYENSGFLKVFRTYSNKVRVQCVRCKRFKFSLKVIEGERSLMNDELHFRFTYAESRSHTLVCVAK